MRAALLVLSAALLVACGKVERGRGGKAPVGPAGGTAAVPAAGDPAPRIPRGPPRVEDSACPECAGHGRCVRCGFLRPCVLCDGPGACALCDGDGVTRDGECPACDGGGRCPECRGDGLLEVRSGDDPADRPPGACPVCLFATGMCPDCAGEGSVAEGAPCLLCAGAKLCPECRGSGYDTWCGGSGDCSSCFGHGRVGEPGEVTTWPPFRLTLRDGMVIEGLLLDTPADTVSIESRERGRVVRGAVASARVEPLDYLLAARRFLDPRDGKAHLRLAERALHPRVGLLVAGRWHLEQARRLDARSPVLGSLFLTASRRRFARVRDAGERALSKENPRLARKLFDLAKNAHAEEARSGDIDARASEARATLVAAEAGLSDELRERKRVAEVDRIARAVRRSEDWRARATSILTGAQPDVTGLHRAQRAAREAWTSVLAAADRAGEGVDTSAARKEGGHSRTLLVRANVAIAQRLLEEGLLERARAVGILAAARDPDDGGAKAFAAIVEAALARRATGEKEE